MSVERRDQIDVRDDLGLTDPFVISEEEGLILLDGTSRRTAKLIAVERRNLAGGEVWRVFFNFERYRINNKRFKSSLFLIRKM